MIDMTKGNPSKLIIKFALPMILGNIFQQVYNLVDTVVVGKFVGVDALAAVGSSFAIVVFITSIIIGLTMGTGVILSEAYGAKDTINLVIKYSVLTSIQQSIMNFGILLVQGLVNTFGTVVMAAFAAGVKIDSLAYMPVQDFGNAFSTYVAQNKGAEKFDRIKEGIKSSIKMIIGFCVIVSAVILLFSRNIMLLFIDKSENEVMAIGREYLSVVAIFYILIGLLFLLYGLYRGLGLLKMSIILTVISLGARVIFAYILSGTKLGASGIWWAIPIGWLLADIIGFIEYKKVFSKMNFMISSLENKDITPMI